MVLQDISDSNCGENFIRYAGRNLTFCILFYLSLVFPSQILYSFVDSSQKEEYHDNFHLLVLFYLVIIALITAIILITPVPGTETAKRVVVHSEIQTDAADYSSAPITSTPTVITMNTAKSVTAPTPPAVPSSNKLAINCIHQNNIYASLSPDEDVLEVVGSDNNL